MTSRGHALDKSFTLPPPAAQPGAPSDGLGGEEGLENFIPQRGVHTDAVVADGQHDERPRGEAAVQLAVFLIEDGVGRFDGHLAHVADGIAGIDTQVGQHLIDL